MTSTFMIRGLERMYRSVQWQRYLSFGLLFVCGCVPQAVAETASSTSAPSSLASFIWLAAGMGALSLLTPCVFPMIPITVSYFTNHAGGDRLAALRNAAVYSAGIIFTFTGLGMVLALLVGASGVNQFAANPWINLLITAIFVAFALNLFGVYFIQVPPALVSRLDAVTRRAGGSKVIGTLLMGLTFTLTSFTCTVPFIGTLLVMAAQGSWKWPLLGMLTFSVVFAIPFFVLALGPQLLSQLPRSGGWLNSVKIVMGFLELAAAMKFISNVDLVWKWGIFTREVVLIVWIVLGAVIVLYLTGLVRFPHESQVLSFSAVRLASGTFFAVITIWLVTGVRGNTLGEIESFLPPAPAASSNTQAAEGGKLFWIVNDYQRALVQAKAENRNIFIDFTGYTCTNCRWMEANMFTRPEIREVLERFVRVQLYTDGEGELFQSHQRMQQKQFGTVALPLYAVVNPDGSTVAKFPGLTRDPAKFLSFLENANK